MMPPEISARYVREDSPLPPAFGGTVVKGVIDVEIGIGGPGVMVVVLGAIVGTGVSM